MNDVKKAMKARDTWNARGSKCPLCGAWFRTDCEHTVGQAQAALEENVIRAVVRDEMKKHG